jgi:hypothetical protein
MATNIDMGSAIQRAAGLSLMLLLPIGSIGCSSSSWTYQAVPNLLIDQPDNLSTQGPLMLKTEPDSVIHADTAGTGLQATPSAHRKTVMIVSWHHDLGTYRSSIGRTLVVTIDGPPKPGQYWLNPDDAVLITYSAYSAPMHDRIDLTGSIRIIKVGPKEIVADVAVKERHEEDSTEFIDRPYDPAYRQFPFHIYGQHTFTIVSANDPAIDRSAVRLTSQ